MLEVKSMGDTILTTPKVDQQSELQQILDNLRFFVDRVKSNDKDDKVGDEWKALAMLLDRTFFWLTTFLAVILIPTFLLQKQMGAANLWKQNNA